MSDIINKFCENWLKHHLIESDLALNPYCQCVQYLDNHVRITILFSKVEKSVNSRFPVYVMFYFVQLFKALTVLALLVPSFSAHAAWGKNKTRVKLLPIAKNNAKYKLEKDGFKLFLNHSVFTSAGKQLFSENASDQLTQLGISHQDTIKLSKSSKIVFDTAAFVSYSVVDRENDARGNSPQGAFDESFYLNLREIYWQKTFNKNTKLSLGRKKMPLSESDDLWKRGVWQTGFLWNKLDPDAHGFIGGFLETKSKTYNFKAFVNAIHIPETGVDFDEEDGKFTSKNPWFNSPADQVDINGKDIPVNYSSEIPSLSDLILNPGLGSKISVKFNKSNSIALAAAYKPMNQLLFRAQHSGVATSNVTVNAVVKPEVIYHTLATAEYKYKFNKSWKLLASYTADSPEQTDFDSDVEIAQRFGDAQIFDLTLVKKLPTARTRSSYWYLSYQNVGGDRSDDQTRFDLTNNIFESRFRFLSSLRLGLNQNSYRIWGMGLSTNSALTYDFDQKGLALLLKNKLHVSRSFYAHLDMTFLGLTGEEAGDGIIRRYRANDSVMLGVGYVF